MNRHHIWWPASDYRTGIWRKLRNLPCMVVMADEEAHRIGFHVMGDPPKRPTHAEAFRLVVRHNEGHCSCHMGPKG